MKTEPAISVSLHDGLPGEEAAVIDAGLGQSNSEAAPLHEVRPLSCFARVSGQVVGGAVGRTWGRCCELQQLWVHPSHRRQGIATVLIANFERAAQTRGCSTIYLDTFSFMAPELYLTLGYETKLSITGFAPGVEKHTMVKHITNERSGA